MSDWDTLCAGLDVGALVPDELARYRPAIIDGIGYFLENLSKARTAKILIEQAMLPREAGIEERLVAIAHQCPVLHKLGQVLARDRRLGADLRSQLQRLESLTPAPGRAWQDILQSEIGHLSNLDIHLEEGALAEGSVALVVPFAWQHAPKSTPNRGVFKILKTGIQDKLEEELDLLQRIGIRLDDRCSEYNLPQIPYENTFEQVSELLRLEVHLDKEQEHLKAARSTYKDTSFVLIPEVYPFCTPRVTAMERIDGCKVTSVAELRPDRRRNLGNLIAKAMIARPVWSSDSTTTFHADPHAGNLVLADDGRLAILDWSLVGTLTKDDQINLCQILIGAMTSNPAQITTAIQSLANGTANQEALRTIVASRLKAIRGQLWPGIRWLTGLMDDAVQYARAPFPIDLLAFRKALLILDGVIADVSLDCDPDAVLAESFINQMALEWGQRFVTQPFSRDFATHMSNVDLAQFMAFAPIAAIHGLLDSGVKSWPRV